MNLVMNFSVFTKPICRFLIHRYMGQYLKTEISSDQLEFRLADGTASVQKVALNTEYINEILDSVGVVSLVDGFVEEISACVPWKKLMTESTVIKISGLGLTLTPLSDINMANTQELVSSMIGSIASSMDLARSVIADEQIADGAENAGVEQFASLIDQVISRIKVIFENLTIRVEAYSDICTGIEIQIDRMEFHDEQLEARQQLEQPGQTITEQPASLYTVTDLNKLLHLQGVRLYTDIWTRNSLAIDRLTPSHTNSSEDEAEGTTMTNSSLNFQSCYSHFSHRSARSVRATAASSSSSVSAGTTEPCIPPTPVLFAQFVSDTRHTMRIRVNNTALSSCNENSAFNKRVDIDIFVGGSLHALLTPSQIALLRDLFSRLVPKRVECTAAGSSAAATAYGGLPMKEEHFQKITDQFMVPDGSRGSANFNFPNFSNRSTWSGAEQFYELLPQLNSAASGTTGKLTSRGPTTPAPHPHSSLTSLQRSCSLESTLSKDQKSNASTATLVERRPDIFTITLRVPTLVAVISHDDPLSEESMKRRTDERGNCDKGSSQLLYNVRTVCQEMAERAEDFFPKAARVKLAKYRLEEQRGLLSDLFSGDHLSLVTNGAVFSLTLVNEHLRNSLQLEGSFEECDFVECLLPASVVIKEGDSNDKTTHHHHHFDVLNLSERQDIASRDVFTFRMHNSPERPHEYSVELNMERCKSDVDISIIDRIRHLIVPKPCFLPSSGTNAVAGGGDSSLGPHQWGGHPFAGLRDNFLSNTVHSNPPSTFIVKFYVSEWGVDFRIPIADFSPERGQECWRRSVHSEHLHSVMKGATLRLPKFTPSNFSHCGELILEAKSAIVSFVGDPASLSCTEPEMKFLHAFNNEGEVDKCVKLRLSYDTRNKSLRSANIVALSESTAPSGLMAKSMFESIFRPRDEDKVEGPFSRTSSYFADTRLVMAGSRTELEEFSEECRPQARMNLELFIPHLNILLPSHKFLELLYNRLANDLALWEPKCPQLKEANRSLSADTANNAPQAIFRPFVNCSAGDKRRADDEEDEEEDDRGGISLTAHDRYAPRFKRKQRVLALAPTSSSHQLTLTLRVEKAHLLIKAGEEHHPAPGSNTVASGHIAAQLSQAELFLVHGFRENTNLSYFYLTSTKANVYHRNLLNAGANGFCAEVESSKFACGRREDIQAEPVPAGEPCALVSDDKVAVCLKLLQYPGENIKDLLVAVALRNTLIHVNPITDSKLFWATQLVDFFTLIDYEIPGYEIPIVKIDLHVHLSSMLLGYNHSTVASHSPMQLKLEIGSCDVTAQLLTQDMERFKFRCLLEDAKLWLRKRRREKVAFVESGGDGSDPAIGRDPFVKVAAVGLMHLLVAYTVASSSSASAENASEPMLELTCVNDVIKMWICTDTMVELLNMAVEFYQSDMGTYLFSSRPTSPTPRASSSTHQLRGREDKSELLVDFVNNANATASFTHRATGTNDRQPPPPGQKELSEEERNRLVAMMASAMEDDPQAAILAAAVKSRRSGRSKGSRNEEPPQLKQLAEIFSEELAEEVTSDVDRSSTSTTTTTNTDDDEFIVVEKIPSASYGVMRMGRNRLDPPDFEIVQTPYRIPPDVSTGEDATQAATGLSPPLDHPPAILRYSISDVSLCVCLYGGSDFGDFPARPQKTYSQWETHRNSGECAEARRESEGGKYRDHTVCVEVKVSKMSFLCEVFNAISPILSLNLLKISDIEVVDRLLVSEINKLFYKHVNYDAPKRLQAPLLSIQMVEDQQREGKLAISLAPIRLNFDQDSLEFLQEFFSYVSANVKWPESTTTHDPEADLPVIEVPPLQRKEPTLHAAEQTSSQERDFGEDREVELNFGGVKFNKRSTPPSQPTTQSSSSALLDFTDPPLNLEDLFSEDDVHIDDAFCAGLSRELERGETRSESLTSLDLKNNDHDEGDDDDEGDDGRPIIDLEQSTRVEATSTKKAAQEETEMPATETNLPSGVQCVQPQRDTFFKEFTFSPACRIRLDYVGKRVKTEQGALIGLLVGLADLHRTELELKELHNQRGLLGLNRCVQYALDEWLQDVRGQIPQVIGSYTPISALVQLTQGIRDLFAIPLSELRREDGQLMRGLQQGASNFGISTASAAIDATQRVASIVQSVAELAFDIVTPDYSLQRQRYSRSSQSSRPRVASDFREGVAMAYDTVSEGVRETAQVLQTAAQEDRASGGTQWGLRGLLRHATPTAIRPIVIASQATVQVLGGIRNSLHPEDHREAMEKWRRREVPGRLVNQQQLRQSYNPSSLMPSQRYIPPPASSSFSHDRY